MTEQFHLSRLQVINWGVFDGYHSIPFSCGGALIAGASGSGKSSLLDAISLGFLPFNRRNFNASGDNTAAGSSAGQKSARIARDDAAKELKRVEHVGSALPEFALAMRDHICAAVGADAAELPYIAELLDLKPDQTRWRLAVEKVLRGAGLRLLVPDQHWAAVLRFVNETDMRGRLQLHHVRAKFLGAELSTPSRTRWQASCSSSTRRIRAPPRPLDVITAAGDHVCVDTPDVFARFRRAVTDTGLYKDSDRLADQGRPAPGQAVRVPVPGRRHRQDQRADTRTRRRRGGLPAGPPRRRRHRRAAPAVARPGRGVQGDLRAVSRSGARSTPRPPTGTPTGCANSTSC